MISLYSPTWKGITIEYEASKRLIEPATVDNNRDRLEPVAKGGQFLLVARSCLVNFTSLGTKLPYQ